MNMMNKEQKQLVLQFWKKDFVHRINFNDDTTNDGVEGYLSHSEDNKILYVWFEGSNSKKDYIINFNFFKSKIPFENIKWAVQVHRGFLKYYKQKPIRDFLHEYIKVMNPEKVITAGHSMGGAIAQLFAFDIHNTFNKEIECYCIDSPKVGNFFFKRAYNKKVPNTYFLINGNDIVPQLPFWWLGFLQIFTLGFFFMFSFKVGKVIHIGNRRWFKLFSFKDHESKRIESSLREYANG